MNEPRKFFLTRITVEVLSEDSPLEWDTLEDVYHATAYGDSVGACRDEEIIELGAKEAAQKLLELGSSPDFFQLSENGKTIN